nr:equilibrative nucleotide transporter 3-like isoform X3 [Physcomitrium patens]|eukprot:XP_024368293.1 equilibrative nucleotide transporter 3-like isoform X3 [Physcomitrella patens]
MADSLSGTSPALEVDEHAHKTIYFQGRTVGYLVCWLLGNGCLFSWNSLITIQDYFLVVFDGYHAARVFTLVYQPFALGTMLILTYHEARINTRLRLISGYTLFFIFILAIPILDLATNGHGGIGAFVGTCIFIAGFGVADAFVQGGMFGEVSFMDSSYVQAFSAGLAASGAITSGLRLICKSSFPNTKDGLRNSALVFFFISAFFEFTCILLYAYVFPRLAFVKYFRTKAASEGSLTVSADLVAVGSTTYRNETDNQQGMKALMPLERLTTSQLLAKNADYCFIICFCFTLTLSIFPGFLAEDTGKHHLGTWYSVTLVAMYNVGDLLGRYIPLIDSLLLKSRPMLLLATLSRVVFIPAFYFTAKYGPQGWMIILTTLLGVSNGYVTVCAFVGAPKGYLGPEQNALGNILVLFLVIGLFVGVVVDWLWLIGKGW